MAKALAQGYAAVFIIKDAPATGLLRRSHNFLSAKNGSTAAGQKAAALKRTSGRIWMYHRSGRLWLSER
jgi:hypothetical protein